MARPVDVTRRAELLDALIAAFSARGIGSRSLREIGEAVGTSHRMLLHHFGSRDALVIAVVEAMEQRQLNALGRAGDDGGVSAVEAQWVELRRPEMWPLERLFFECYARAAQGEQPFVAMLPGAVDDWVTAVVNRNPGVDPAMVRLGLAVTRGLLLDLVATGDVAGVDAAHEAWLALLAPRSGRRS